MKKYLVFTLAAIALSFTACGENTEKKAAASAVEASSAKAVSNSAVSLLEGLKENAGSKLTISYEKGYELTSGDRVFSMDLTFAEDKGEGFKGALSLAKKSDLVVYVMGEDALQSGEGRSQVDISLKGRQVELLKQVLQVNKNVIVVLMNGRPIIEPWVYENAPAILEV